MEDPPRNPRAEPVGSVRATGPSMDLAWTALPVQVVLTGLVTYIVIAILSVVGGTFTEGLQVVGFAVFSTPLTVAAFVLGLPLRLVPRARVWWFRHAEWAIAAAGFAVTILCLSFFVGSAAPVHHDATTEWPASDGYMPDLRLFVAALGVLAVAAMHALPPRRARRALRASETRPVSTGARGVREPR